MKLEVPSIRGTAMTLMVALVAGMGLLLTFSHIALRLSDAITMHVRAERLRGAAIAQSLASGAWGALGPTGDQVLRHLQREASKTLDGVKLDAVNTEGIVVHSTEDGHEGTSISIARLTFGSSDGSLMGVSYTGPTHYESSAILHGRKGPEGYLLLSFSSDAVARAIQSEITIDVVIGVTWLVLLVALSLPLVRHLTKPLTKLAADVTALGEGEHREVVPIPTAIHEVEVLQGRFATLASALREKELENRSLFERLRHQVDVVTRDLEQTNVFLRSVLKSLRSALVTTDHTGVVTTTSERTEEVCGKSIEIGAPLSDQLTGNPRAPEAVRTVLAGGAPERLELRPTPGRFVDLQLMPLEDATGERVGALAKLEDVSQQRKLEQQVQRAERLSTVGEISAGFAHEFGNSMHVVLGLGKVLLSELPHDAPGRADVLAMVKESEQAAALVGRFKLFASPSRGKLGDVDVEAIVRDAGHVLDKELRRHRVTFTCDAAPNLPRVRGDAALLRQAVLNLMLNAIQAMPTGGALSAKLARTEHGGLKLAITDTGTGIDPANLPRIFDPFFTTKREGEGTGLGLSVVQTVVTLHEATIDVDSALGRGTTFEISFPAPPDEEE
ncbi:ATP-binding protein [Myxococcota bacterium]|nr:ATP-binding protein [Myxococcota bacterium]